MVDNIETNKAKREILNQIDDYHSRSLSIKVFQALRLIKEERKQSMKILMKFQM